MAGAGKSTVGKLLAQELQYAFVDTDDRIREINGASLKGIIEQVGLTAFKQKEAEAVLTLQADATVIATGGSVVYSGEAMRHLQSFATIVWLKLSHETIKARIGNPADRGLVVQPGQTIDALFNEREPLYAQYADATIDAEALSPAQIAATIRQAVNHA